jgi:p-hydroxybenzoate 3-monooxygenase
MADQTQVGIVGAGPAGLLLSHLLHLQGIESVVLESRSREYVEQRVRAGVLEQGSVDVLTETGVGERLKREGLEHRGINLHFGGKSHRIDFPSLTGGRTITVYGQQEVVKDLIAARLSSGGETLFEAEALRVDGLEEDRPRVSYRQNGEEKTLECQMLAGCDGSHGVCREAIPVEILRGYERVYPFGWLGILAEAAPSSEELIYANHERGFALHSMRSPTISRNYLQVAPDEDLGEWPDQRIWEELQRRMETDAAFSLRSGPIVEKGVTSMRSFVTEPMQYRRLFLAGDAAHIVPATGAKGMNLAIADVRVLAEALTEFFARGAWRKLESYSATCLRRVWRAQHFSWWMTSMLHRMPGDDEYGRRLQLAQLEYVCASEAGATSLAENYVGLEFHAGPPA